MDIKYSKEKYTIQLENILESKPGHLYTITFTDISVNNVIASGSWDGTVRLHDENKELEVIYFFKEPIEGLRFSPNGKYLAVGIENEIHIYEMNDKKSFRLAPKEQAMRGSVFTWSEDSSKLACIFYDNSIRIYDVLNQKELGLINDVPSLGGNIIAWKKDILAVGLNNSQIALYNLNSAVFQLAGSLEGHQDIVNAVAFSNIEDEMILYSVSSDGTLRSWDLSNNSKTRVIHSHTSSLLYLAIKQTFSGQLLVICPEKENLIFLEEQFQGKIPLENSSYCNASINATADKFVRGINDHDLGIFSLKDLKQISVLEGKNDQINSVEMLNDVEIIYASGDKNLHLVNIKTHEEHVLKAHNESVSSISVSKDKKSVVSASFDDTIRLWDIPSRKEKKIVTQKAELPSAVLFNEDGSTVFCASGGDFSIRGYSLDGTSLFSESIHEEYVNKLLLYKNGFFSIADDKKVIFWTNNKGRILARGNSEVTAISVSSDYELLAFGTVKGVLTVIEIKSGQKRAELNFGRKINCCAFSPDQTFIAIGSHTHLIVHEFETKENTTIYTFYEPIKEIFWSYSLDSNPQNFLSQVVAVSVAREVITGNIVLTSTLENETPKLDKLKEITDTQIIQSVSEESVTELHSEKKIIQEPVIHKPIESSELIEAKFEKIVEAEQEIPSEPENEQINLLEKFQEEVESMVSSEKEVQNISDFSTNLTRNMSSLELGSLVYNEYLETLKHLDKIQELIQVNSDETHEGFKIIFNRIKRLKPVINEALEEIDFILD